LSCLYVTMSEGPVVMSLRGDVRGIWCHVSAFGGDVQGSWCHVSAFGEVRGIWCHVSTFGGIRGIFGGDEDVVTAQSEVPCYRHQEVWNTDKQTSTSSIKVKVISWDVRRHGCIQGR